MTAHKTALILGVTGQDGSHLAHQLLEQGWVVHGGFRRGTDIFKALAMGAKAICIGRPYVWGLGAFGQQGVEKVLEILRGELVRIMQLAGTNAISEVTPPYIAKKSC